MTAPFPSEIVENLVISSTQDPNKNHSLHHSPSPEPDRADSLLQSAQETLKSTHSATLSALGNSQKDLAKLNVSILNVNSNLVDFRNLANATTKKQTLQVKDQG